MVHGGNTYISGASRADTPDDIVLHLRIKIPQRATLRQQPSLMRLYMAGTKVIDGPAQILFMVDRQIAGYNESGTTTGLPQRGT